MIPGVAPPVVLDTSKVEVKRIVIEGVWVEADVASIFDAKTGTLTLTFERPRRAKRRAARS